MARSRPIDTAGQKGFKVLVLDEVDRISKEAQHSLRRTMEKYSAACRLVLCCNNVSKVRDDKLSASTCDCARDPSADVGTGREPLEVARFISKFIQRVMSLT